MFPPASDTSEDTASAFNWLHVVVSVDRDWSPPPLDRGDFDSLQLGKAACVAIPRLMAIERLCWG